MATEPSAYDDRTAVFACGTGSIPMAAAGERLNEQPRRIMDRTHRGLPRDVGGTVRGP
jgi:hypothetical protein